jgi:hypothetical protein
VSSPAILDFENFKRCLNKNVRLSLYDTDGHSLNCNYGLCGANKKSYGVAIFADGENYLLETKRFQQLT